jgi:hypothetical protein
MARGGLMPDGTRRGGRRPGSKNKATLELERAARHTVKDADSLSPGQMPKEFLLAISQNEALPLATRVDAAKAVVGFYSPKLVAQHNLNQDAGQYWISDVPMTPEEWEAEFCQPIIEGHGQQPVGVTMNHVDALRLEVSRDMASSL